MKIYFKMDKKPESIKDLIIEGYSDYYTYFKPTFFDPECTVPQCHRARRSFLDLYNIVNTYFPKTGKQEFAYILLNQIPNLTCFYCTTIGKFVFLKEGSSDTCLFDDRMGKADYPKEYKGSTDGVSFSYIEKLSKAYEAKQSKLAA